MRLIAFTLQGYRRFIDRTSVKLHGDLVAFVGPNEAGKSSLLEALVHLSKEGDFAPNEAPRRTTHEPELAWHFQLEADDKSALADVHDAGHVERAVVTKRNGGRITWVFEPRPPLRDRNPRNEAADQLAAIRERQELAAADSAVDHAFSLNSLDDVIGTLRADVETYQQENLDGIRNFTHHQLRPVEAVDILPDKDETSEARFARHEEWAAIRNAATDVLDRVVELESIVAPRSQCAQVLTSRLPQIVMFRDEDRRLESRYDLNEVADGPPAALGHLADLAELDLRGLRDEVNGGRTADVATRRNAANRRLIDAFDQSWNQQGIAIQVEVQGAILHIHATTPEDDGLSEFEDRSDGMRWFAALLAFTKGWSADTILLVDEIERHLHYDAQADLVDVLTRQSFTSKVLYTT